MIPSRTTSMRVGASLSRRSASALPRTPSPATHPIQNGAQPVTASGMRRRQWGRIDGMALATIVVRHRALIHQQHTAAPAEREGFGISPWPPTTTMTATLPATVPR